MKLKNYVISRSGILPPCLCLHSVPSLFSSGVKWPGHEANPSAPLHGVYSDSLL